ncbi:CRISPR-associated endoribonuclease Cas13a [Bienertia sinuspersici]
MEKSKPFDGGNAYQNFNEANLDWLSELDERVGANKGDQEIYESENESEEESAEEIAAEEYEGETKRVPTIMNKVHIR